MFTYTVFYSIYLSCTMKWLIYVIVICLLSINYSIAYTPPVWLVDYLEEKVALYEGMIQEQWEPMRAKMITALETLLTIAPENKYRDIDQERFSFIISFLLENIASWSSDMLTIDDFRGDYDWFSIVQVPEQIVATVRNMWPLWQTNDDSFDNLAWFIFGDNTSNTKIAMTSPVTRTQIDQNMYETAFIMPLWRTLDTLPLPNNQRVQIKTLPSSLKAVRRFSWAVTKEIVEQERSIFQNDLRSQWIKRYGLPILSQYDGPWVPLSQKRNELRISLNPN